MAISVISISSDSSEESVGISIARVILFGTIPTTISSTAPIVDLPISHDDTLLIPTDTPTILPVVPTIPPTAPTIQYIYLFICTDSSHSNTSERPPSHDPYEATVSQGRSRVAACLSLPSPLIPDYSSSDHFTSDDSSRDSPSNSSSETSSDSHSDTLFDSSSRHSSSGYVVSNCPCDSPTATSAGPSRKRHSNVLDNVQIVNTPYLCGLDMPYQLSGKTDSIKIENYILGCLLASTFVLVRVFKLDSLQLLIAPFSNSITSSSSLSMLPP
ncbi:hypothetical protein Tco_1155315 [Tanacetum coccineum]